jgi:predicted transcriptional regulator YheO
MMLKHMDSDIGALCLNFTIDIKINDVVKNFELKPNGNNIPVTKYFLNLIA